MTTPKASILVIDDEPDMLEVCRESLLEPAYRTETETSALKALERLREKSFDLLVVDLRMPDMDGIQLLSRARQYDPDILGLIITGHPTIDTAVEAVKQGAFDYLAKPFTPDQLRTAVGKALVQRRVYEENRALRKQLQRSYEVSDVVGQSQAMGELLGLVRKIGPTDTNVLLLGESGTGKELIARCIHWQSLRREYPMVPIDCAALPETLAEAELFGYEKGAFTGAAARTPGLLEIANNGTFFLDEVCELPPNLQVKLLRVLQERQIRRVGGRRQIDVDIRVIAATNRDLNEAVAQGIFRGDLFYRLNTITVRIPPLRERAEDIPLLVNHFIRKFEHPCRKEVEGITPQALDLLCRYPWPGNVRELSNVVERALTLIQTPYLDVCDLPHEMAVTVGGHPALLQDHSSFAAAKREAIRFFEKEFLDKLLSQCSGNVSRAAREASLTRSSLQRLLRRHGLKTQKIRVPPLQ